MNKTFRRISFVAGLFLILTIGLTDSFIYIDQNNNTYEYYWNPIEALW